MNNKKLIEEAKNNTKGIYGTLYLSSLIAGISRILSNIIPVLGMAAICGPLDVGLTKIYDDAVNKKKPSEKDIIKPFKNQWGSSFFASIAIDLYLFGTILTISVLFIVVTIVFNIIQNLIFNLQIDYQTLNDISNTIGVIRVISIVAIIIVAVIKFGKKIALSEMTYYILMKEPELDGDQALRKSINIMKDHVSQYWKLVLSTLKYMILSIIFVGVFVPIVNYVFIKFCGMVYEGEIEKEIHEEAFHKFMNEESRKRKENLDKREQELKEEAEKAKKQEEELNTKLAELENKKKEQENKNESIYNNALDLIKKATSSDEYKFVNYILESLGDYKDAKTLLVKYRKIEKELRNQEDILNN